MRRVINIDTTIARLKTLHITKVNPNVSDIYKPFIADNSIKVITYPVMQPVNSKKIELFKWPYLISDIISECSADCKFIINVANNDIKGYHKTKSSIPIFLTHHSNVNIEFISDTNTFKYKSIIIVDPEIRLKIWFSMNGMCTNNEGIIFKEDNYPLVH